MSFASETKNELARIVPEKKCCMLAEIAGFMRLAGSVKLVGGGRFEIVMTTSNAAVARHVKTLIKKYFSIDTSVGVGRSRDLRRNNEYVLSIGTEQLSEQILREVGILIVKEGMNSISDGIYDALVKTKCCRKAYLRGAFLGAGTVNNPEKGYHFELNARTEVLAGDIKRLLNSFTDIHAGVVKRKKGYGVYIKAGEQVRDAIGIMGASGMFFKFDETMMMKGIRSQTSRINNLDNANIDRAVRAAQQQIASINKVIDRKGFGFLSPKLREAAAMRLKHPEAGIEELGRMMVPPLTKSGINNRLRRIERIAEEL